MTSFNNDEETADDRSLDARMFEAAAMASGITAGQMDAHHATRFDRPQRPLPRFDDQIASSTSSASSMFTAPPHISQSAMNRPSVFARRQDDLTHESGSSVMPSGVSAPSSSLSSSSIGMMEDRWANDLPSPLLTKMKKECTTCGTTESPEWRKGSDGRKSLCNACGLRLSRNVTKARKDAERRSMAEEVALNGGAVPESMQRKLDDDRQKRQAKSHSAKAIRKASTSSALSQGQEEDRQQPQHSQQLPMERAHQHGHSTTTTNRWSQAPSPREQHPSSFSHPATSSYESVPFAGFRAPSRTPYAPQAPYMPPHGWTSQISQVSPSQQQSTSYDAYAYPYPPSQQLSMQPNLPYDEIVSSQSMSNFLSTPAFDLAADQQQNTTSFGLQRQRHHQP